MPLLTNYFYQYFKSNQSVQLQTDLKQTTLKRSEPLVKKPDAYKNINSSSIQTYTNKLT